MRGALADAAVSDDLFVGGDALVAVDRLQLLDALEAAVLRVDSGAPRDTDRRRDVAAALRALLRKVLRREQLTRVLLGLAHVHQAGLAKLGVHVVAVRANFLFG